MNKIINIITTKYSTLFKEIIYYYKNDCKILINNKEYKNTIEEFINTWCINKNIQSINDFILYYKGKEIFGFHDSLDNLWINYSEIDFIKILNNKKICKYKILQVKLKE